MIVFMWVWNLFLTIVIVALFVPWWGFIFGAIWPAVLILITSPGLFLLPALLAAFYWFEY